MNLPQIHQPSKTDFPSLCTVHSPAHTPSPEVSRGDKTKARDILVGEVALAEKSTKDEAEILLDKVLTEA